VQVEVRYLRSIGRSNNSQTIGVKLPKEVFSRFRDFGGLIVGTKGMIIN